MHIRNLVKVMEKPGRSVAKPDITAYVLASTNRNNCETAPGNQIQLSNWPYLSPF